MDTAILIPAYKPVNTLVELAKELRGMGFYILIVDDGSGADYSDIFSAAEEYATVLHLEKNRGKGGALKYGIEHLANTEGIFYFVTADADGQHLPKDIANVAEEAHKFDGIVIGARKLGRGIPLRSKIGNSMSRMAYALTTGRFVHDNQSGLRAFPIELADWLIGINGTKYDYEVNVLMYAARQGVPITEIPIETVYIDNNSSSHFDPIMDTLRIHARIWRASPGTVIGYVLGALSFLIPLSASDWIRVGIAYLIAALVSLIIRASLWKRIGYALPNVLAQFCLAVLRASAYNAVSSGLIYLGLPIAVSMPVTLIAAAFVEYYAHKAIYNKDKQ